MNSLSDETVGLSGDEEPNCISLVSNWWHREEAVRRIEAFGECLCDVVPAATVFNSRPWLVSAAKNVPKDRTLLVLTVTLAEETQAIVPVTIGVERIAGIPVRTVRLLGYPYSDRMALMVRPDCDAGFRSIVTALASCPMTWDVVIFDELLLSDVDQMQAAVDTLGKRMRVRVRHSAISPFYDLQGVTVEDLESGYSRSLRTRLKRARKKQNANGKVTFERVLAAPQDVDDWLAKLAIIENASWKGKAGVGIFSPGDGLQFFKDVSHELAKRSYLDIMTMYLDDVLIAYRYGFRFKNCFLDYNLAHLPEFSDLSPGRVLLDEVIRSSIKEGLTAVDASRGSLQPGHLLRDWTSEKIDHYVVWVFGLSWRGRFLHFLTVGLKPWLQTVMRRIQSKNIG